MALKKFTHLVTNYLSMINLAWFTQPLFLHVLQDWFYFDLIERMRRVHRLSDGYRNSEQDVGNTQSLTLTIQLCHLWTMTFPPLPFCPLNTGSDDSFEVDENSIIYIMIEKFE